MNIFDVKVFIAGFSGSVVIASIVVYLAGDVGGPRRGARPGTDFYTGPAPEGEAAFTVPNLTDVTPIHPHGESREHAGTVDPRR